MSLDFLEKTEVFRRFVDDLRLQKEGLMVAGPVEPAVPYFLTCLSREIKKRIIFIQPRSWPLSRLEDGCRFYFSQFSLASGLEILPELELPQRAPVARAEAEQCSQPRHHVDAVPIDGDEKALEYHCLDVSQPVVEQLWREETLLARALEAGRRHG